MLHQHIRKGSSKTRFFLFLALLFNTVVTCSISQAITYKINSWTLDRLSDEYLISGGFITTNGTLGPLSAEDIIDYRIEVTGPVPFVFLPTNPTGTNVSNLVSVRGVVEASATELFLPLLVPPTSQNSPNRITFWAQDHSIDGCFNCIQELSYQQKDNFFPDSVILFRMTPGGDGGQEGFTVGDIVYQPPLTQIVVASVPECTTCSLALAALCLVMGRRWGK